MPPNKTKKKSFQNPKLQGPKLFILLTIMSLIETNLCGTNERGLPRVAGDTWMEDCNRCRCTENLLPGCTKRFCNIPGLTGEKPLPGM